MNELNCNNNNTTTCVILPCFIFSYKSTKNILFPSNQCRVCCQPLSLFCSQCNRSAGSQPSRILRRSRKTAEKKSNTLQKSPKRTKKLSEILDISSKRRKKKRKSEGEKGEATTPASNTVEWASIHTIDDDDDDVMVGYQDDDVMVGYQDDYESLNDKEEDWGCVYDVSSDSQPKQVRLILYIYMLIKWHFG